jgi:filamin
MCGGGNQRPTCKCVCLPGEVRMPSGKTARPNITDNKDGTITVRYAPTEKGLHQMGIKYDGNHIPGESGAG